jgi:DMSO/TMAO reductase YedYZ molybdopterin-dependent catalytic subunit
MHRRSVLHAGALLGATAWLNPLVPWVERLLAQTCEPPRGELLGLVPLHADRPRPTPFGQVVGGAGLDARMFTDLSVVDHNRLITPTADAFVRTTAPPTLRPTPARWSIALRGADGAPSSVDIETLRRDARSMGAHLIECAGNTDPDNFGLMSVAEWDGVALTSVLANLNRASAASVLVSGVDDEVTESRSSNPGASWIVPLAHLERLGAFLAVRMNGEPLTPDHGAPVRLVIPGWYGCSWIKWVNQIQLVGADTPSTSQMIEFSRRTHQEGIPARAIDYEPPVIDLAATPVRVEKRRFNGSIEYRVVGIVWGGDRPVDRLLIRFKAGETPQPFALCPVPRTHRMWSVWEYRWRPNQPGVYDIALRAADPSIRTRRLDISFYVRRVVIDF